MDVPDSHYSIVRQSCNASQASHPAKHRYEEKKGQNDLTFAHPDVHRIGKQRTWPSCTCKTNLLSCPVLSCLCHFHVSNTPERGQRKQGNKISHLLRALFFCSIAICECIRVVHLVVLVVWCMDRTKGVETRKGHNYDNRDEDGLGLDWKGGRSVHHVVCMRCMRRG